jgi:hypothetical protein
VGSAVDDWRGVHTHACLQAGLEAMAAAMRQVAPNARLHSLRSSLTLQQHSSNLAGTSEQPAML